MNERKSVKTLKLYCKTTPKKKIRMRVGKWKKGDGGEKKIDKQNNLFNSYFNTFNQQISIFIHWY
jgi:hypothetical protein